MLKEQVTRLTAYNEWANRRVAQLLRQPAAAAMPEPLRLFSHVLAAESIWLCRLRQLPITETPQSAYTIEDCSARIPRLAEEWRSYFSVLTEEEVCTGEVTYRNMAGEAFTSPVRDVLTHIVNHGTYHRGQVVQLLKGVVSPLPVTDFIAYSRGLA